jgi:hypothetical protein
MRAALLFSQKWTRSKLTFLGTMSSIFTEIWFAEDAKTKGWFFKRWLKNYYEPTLRETQYTGLNFFI